MKASAEVTGLHLASPRLTAIQAYWNDHIHDLQVSVAPLGTPAFFDDLERYRFQKLHYLPRLVRFSAYTGQRLLEVGCGAGIDLVRFASAGVIVTGVDLAASAVHLARLNLSQHGLAADLAVMNGEALAFESNAFDVVYAHGVLPYTADAGNMVGELHRVLRPGGEAILMTYNLYSWLRALRKVTAVGLEHEDAPVFKMHSPAEFRGLLERFRRIRIVPERFPVATRLHHGLKATLFNDLFVRAFNRLPAALTRPFGWHLVAFATK